MERHTRRARWLIDLGYLASILLLVYLSIRYLMWWIAPLLLGIGIAMALRPLVDLLCRNSGAARSFCAIILLLFVYAILIVLPW